MSISTHIGDAYVMATTSAQVQQLYVAYLGRAADKTGLDYWLNDLNSDPAVLTLEDLRSNFVNEQPEYTDAYAGLSRQDTVIKVYNNLFGRAPDTEGLAYWTTGNGSVVNADQLLAAFINGASAADAQVVTNKVLVAEVYTSTADANYAKEDAISILDGVNGTATSVAAAIVKLEDGSLSGIAIPAGVAALKAAAIAEKAIIDFEASKVTELTALNKAVVDLNTKSGADADLDDLGVPTGDEELTYADVDQAITNALELRKEIGGATSVLKANADQAVVDLAATRLAFTKAETGNVDLALAYEKAITVNASLKFADEAAVSTSISKTAVDFTAAATAANGTTALAKANTDAGLTGDAAVATADDLYKALTNPDATADQVSTITKAFDTFLGTSTDYVTLKTLAATDYAKGVAEAAESEANGDISGTEGSVGAAYKADVADKISADKTYADAQAADALVAQAQAITTAHDALDSAAGAVVIPDYVTDLNDSTNGAATSDLFHFAGAVTSTDFTIGTTTASTQFNKGDALYIGEGYSLNTEAKYDATTGLTGGKNGSLEVFFIKDAGVVKAVIETTDLGSSTVTAASLTTEGSSTDGVSVITLTGVTDIAQVSFANGVISHVA